MRKSLTAIFLAAAAFVGVGMATPHQAAAAETGPSCRPLAEVKKAMEDEHQLFVVMANRGKKDTAHLNSQGEPTTKFNAVMYYYNPQDHTGYVISSDKSIDEAPTCKIIESHVQDVVLPDARIDGLDPLVMVAANRPIALQECIYFKTDIGSCIHNDYLQELRQQHLNVYFQAVMQNKSRDGRPLPPTKLTVVGAETPGEPGGVEFITSTEGATVPSAVFSQVLYAPKGSEILVQRARPK
jgi:hypothetical protein